MERQKLFFLFFFVLVFSQTLTSILTNMTTLVSNDDENASTAAIAVAFTHSDSRRSESVSHRTPSLDRGSPVLTDSTRPTSPIDSFLPTTTTLCPPVSETTLTNRTGMIVFTELRRHCSEIWKWNIHLSSSEDGIVLQFNSIHLRNESYLSITTYSVEQYRVTTEKLHPLLLTTNQIQLVFETSGYNSQSLSYISITYVAHPAKKMPKRAHINSSEFYNCSGDVLIPSVLRCNTMQECIDNEDEGDCDQTQQGCGDWVSLHDSCLKLVAYSGPFNSYNADLKVSLPERLCSDHYRAQLVRLKNLQDASFVARILKEAGVSRTFIGAKKVIPVSQKLRHLYRVIFQYGGRGGPMAFVLNMKKRLRERLYVALDCSEMSLDHRIEFFKIQCKLTEKDVFICMKPRHPNPKVTDTVPLSVHLPNPGHHIHHFPAKECSDGSLVQKFRNCYLDSRQDTMTKLSDRFALFPCRHGPPVHYTFVCDGNADCVDNSDETDCGKVTSAPLLHLMFRCDNSQFVPELQRCDGRFDCFDESDEEKCTFCHVDEYMPCEDFGCVPYYYSRERWPSCGFLEFSTPKSYRGCEPTVSNEDVCNSSFVVRMDGFGMAFLAPSQGNNTDGMFYCREGNYYIPSFLLINGELDCWSGEDENIPIGNLTCPGFYRCYISMSCVHPDQVCDGIHHCPYKDDERYCDLVCPDECLCEGHAFVCTQFSSSSHFLLVRYLDLSGSVNVSLRGIEFLGLLHSFNLSHCGLDTLYLYFMPKLATLDLSFNKLKNVSSLALEGLPGLRVLDVSDNPLTQVLDAVFETFIKVSGLSSLKRIVMRNTEISSIRNGAFCHLTQLEILDIRKSFINNYDEKVFLGLSSLQQLYTDDSKLCCPYFHGSRSIDCVAPFDELSSCGDLLRDNFFRIFLWLIALLAIFGNAGVVLYQLVAAKHNTFLVFRVLVISLCIADFIMGMYMMVIGIADAHFHGVYVTKENAWKRSTVCTMAGVLGFVSSEASAMTVCLITVDRVLVLHFPLQSRFHLTARSSFVACGVLWFVAATLAVLPILTGLEFYGVSSICLPLPFTWHQFYSFGVFITFNIVLFVLIGLGQILIFQAILSAGKAACTSRRPSEMTIARRLFLVILSDFCCWFPVGVVGLLVASGNSVPGEVNVWTAIIVLPLNSALNPFLYTLNNVLEKRKKEILKRKTEKVLSNIQTQLPLMTSSTAEQLVGLCIRSDVVKRERILQMLQSSNQN